jgi:dihydroflavonol-4-reductase
MKVFIVGGTGLIGYETSHQLIASQHEVIALALPPLSKTFIASSKMQIILKSYEDLNDEELLKLMDGCQGFVFAAGIDERIESEPPITSLYERYNIQPVDRLLKLAKQAGIKSAVILGSYFSHFHRKYPEWKLTEFHPYIASRIKQAEVALSYADESMNVAVLEMPYIFGIQPGREPVWTILVRQIMKMRFATFYPKGGTTMITLKQAVQAVVGALINNKGGNNYPIGYFNLTWKEMLAIFHIGLGYKKRKIITIPNWLYQIYINQLSKNIAKKGIDMGLKMEKFTNAITNNLFIDKNEASSFLGVTDDDLKEAIIASIRQSFDALQRPSHYQGMKLK